MMEKDRKNLCKQTKFLFLKDNKIYNKSIVKIGLSEEKSIIEYQNSNEKFDEFYCHYAEIEGFSLFFIELIL